MANVLNTDKQIAVISALAEGSSIRSIERITGVHRDTIMRLLILAGERCTKLMDSQMRNLQCKHIQSDEIWMFVGKKKRRDSSHGPIGDPNENKVLTLVPQAIEWTGLWRRRSESNRLKRFVR